MSAPGEAADFENPQPAPQSVQESPVKVRKQLPQRGVDEFWQKFTTKFPGKVHSILPADIYAKTKASKNTKGVVNGQIAVKSYDQAAAECKHAVEKIAKECRRVNHKYRDPHFDIEFDLKRNRRDCLDALGEVPDKTYPKSVKRIPDIFENPVFFEEGATASDVRQGFNGDCWFLSALCALCNKKDLVNNVCVARDEEVGVYGFVFHRDGEWIQTIIDDKLYLIASDWWESSDEEKRVFWIVNRGDAEKRYRKVNQTGSKALYFAQCSSENETWLPLLEKAFAKAHGDYSAIDGGFTGEAIEDLTGGVTTELFTTDVLNKHKFWEEIMKVNEEFLFSCAAGTFDKWQGSDLASSYGARENIVRMHAYSIMEAREIKGNRLLKVRNPWGEGEWRGAWSDGSEQWTPEWMELLNHRFGDDGQFWISYEDLLREYSSFDRTRLFGPDWQITQQWTSVDVPWSADYNKTKFSVTLTKRSPVVIVLSQLDDRYYKGLQGQYTFELHFRLDKDGEQDYIVRSHGNYSMSRSVSTDLELDPGTYSVLMKITARRYQDDDTPEDIIRKNVKLRQNKLIQTGLAYDLAHAKGEIRETEAEKQERQKGESKRKAAEKKKQCAMKREDMLKNWQHGKREKAREKRHAKKREEYERKKAEKRRGSRRAEGTVAGDATAVQTDQAIAPEAVNVTTAAPGVETELEKQSAAGAIEDKTGEPTLDPAPLPKPPSEAKADESKPTNGAPLGTIAEESKPTNGTLAEDNSVTPKNEEKDAATSTEDSTAQKSRQFEAALKSIPSVTVNGAPTPISEAPAPSVAAPSSLAPNDDYQYDSDASFESSIDSVLDFPTQVDDPAEEDYPSPMDGADDNTEFENDPWNAVCVVGLRVFFKDGACSIETVRPRQEEESLDLDDASKGASGEVESDGK
ncbi:hypothetical protein HO133_007865 [Letharia lupina]|uniref:Calpain catalytic domain-containing protein n=1 Tax=Letharia lupina TaxID=560253 RepID=A0A8H6CRB8_9LECA|nr:uncharacterized protein HO133_007865 [Letharia lupina]KAF6228137.1 hypothetical protein HO133_007865 [Letharia lupina]